MFVSQITTTLKTFRYKYPFASAMDKVREHIRNCRLFLISPDYERNLSTGNGRYIEYLRTVKDIKGTEQLDEFISTDWFI